MIRTKTGTVVSDVNDKTIVIEVKTYVEHSIYKKKFPQTRKFHAHDPENQYKLGDTVTIYETTPVSKQKKWTVVNPETSIN